MLFSLTAYALLVAAPVGDVYVADAGTLVVSGTAVRLEGIDVAGPRTPAGQQARAWVQGFLDGKVVTCRMDGAAYGYAGSGRCFADGQDIADKMVAAGVATALQ